jgi:hypothetical protein
VSVRALIVASAMLPSIALVACAAQPNAERVPCPAAVVTVGEDVVPSCDVVPPTRLDVEMRRDDGAAQRCADMGGRFTPAADPEAGEDVCVGVDY